MRYLTTYEISTFPDWRPGEVEELRIESWQLGDSDWGQVARLSVSAVRAGVGNEGSGEQWRDFGVEAGLVGRNLEAFQSLHTDPICVSPQQWINGRHRGFLIQQAGAVSVAVVDLEYIPAYVRDE